MTIGDLAGSSAASTLLNLPETYLYIAIGIVLLIGAMIPILIYCIIQKCCRSNRGKLQINQNSSLRNGLTNGDDNYLTAINSNSLQMDLFSKKDNEYEEFQTKSNIYELPSCDTTSSPKNRFIPTPQLSSTLKFPKSTNFGTSNLQNEYSESEENSLSRTDKNSSLKKPVIKQFQRLPAIPHCPSSTNSLAGKDYESDSESNIYEVPLYDEKPQQYENSLLDDEYGYLIPNPMSFGNRQHIDNDTEIEVPEQWAPGYYKCYAKRNNSFLHNACNLKPNENYTNSSKKTGSEERNSGHFWKIL